MGGKHLVFFDGSCGLCDRAVQWILQRDKRGDFLFAPLQGETAKKRLQDAEIRFLDTMVLIEWVDTEKEQKLVFGKAALRIAWLLGGRFALIGALSFLPGIFFNWIYRLIAKMRHRLFNRDSECLLPNQKYKKRFLP